MLKSLHTKLVLILVALILSVMAIVGTFLVSSVTEYNISEFQDEMANVFTQDFILSLENTAKEGGSASLKDYMIAYSVSLGINQNRNFYILDGKSGEYIAGSDDESGMEMALTPNMLTAMNGQVGQEISPVGTYFDVAVPVEADDTLYIVGVLDNKEDLNSFTRDLISALVRAMLFGMVIVVLLSYILSKTITNPVEKLTKTATEISRGKFENVIDVESGDEIGVLTHTFNDMASALKNSIDAMDGERNKLNTMFVHMKDGIVAFDKDGKLIHINPAAEKMLGESKEGTHYKNVFKNLHIDKNDLSESGNYIEIDYATPGAVLKLFIAPFDSGDGGGLIIVLHDITEQKKLDDSRREFVANVSHELRTPLTNIKGYTETLLSADDIDAETRKSFLSVVYSESDRMTRIVKDLLTLSRLDHGKVEMKQEVTDINRIVENAVSSMRIEAVKQNITLECSLENEMKTIGDGERLTQVVINLISNALKYNKKDGAVYVYGAVEDKMAVISVRDTGIGIPESDLPRIFERFYRVDKARSRERGGTGLGLAIAKEITEQHGGSMSISSVYGEGTTLTMKLPLFEEKE
ncbi:MAG: HAMP domain-containing protein [Clostridia bacterium]|nr:HAMP domain-containing protein [Clostridia bacterium]MBQ6867112.1 HAMP domain-containing protein [Clostridia bacterium]